MGQADRFGPVVRGVAEQTIPGRAAGWYAGRYMA